MLISHHRLSFPKGDPSTIMRAQCEVPNLVGIACPADMTVLVSASEKEEPSGGAGNRSFSSRGGFRQQRLVPASALPRFPADRALSPGAPRVVHQFRRTTQQVVRAMLLLR